MRKIITGVLTVLMVTVLQAQSKYLQSGPMVGYSTMKEVMLTAQTTKQANVYFEYWNIKSPKKTYTTATVTTQKENAFMARVLADKLEPSNTYHYKLFINKKEVTRPYRLEFQSQPIWLWRGDAPDFTFATGSCAYISEKVYDRPGKPYGSEYQIFESIYKVHPDFMLWLGDNTYLREADWNSKTGIRYRYTHTRSTPEMQAMLGSMHHYAIWDDHDYGPNNSDRSYPMHQETEHMFKTFFANPNTIFDEGITGQFQWADCEFFLLDNRTWRTPNKRTDIEHHEILGERQIEWLLDALVNSYAPFKFVVIGGQFVNPLKHNESHANYAPEERFKIIKAIERLKINGVIFLSGDVHHTELSKLDLEGGYPLYDLTVSPLTSGVGGRNAEKNPTQVKGTLRKAKSFATMNVHGSRRERTLDITIYNSNGKLQWKKQLKAADLRFPREKK